MTTTDNKKIPEWQRSMAGAMTPREYEVSIHITDDARNPSFIRNEFNNLALEAQTHTHPQKDLIKLQEADGNGVMILTATFTNSVSACNFERKLTEAKAGLLKAYGFTIATGTVDISKPRLAGAK